MQITVYTTTTSPYCKTLEDYLEERNFSFTEKIIDQDDAAKEEMIKESGGFLGVPFTVIVKDDGVKVAIIGFDKGKINETLGIQK
ncbi:MAG: glutaredoxin family protein [Microgenomates group bacterium]